MAGLPRKSDSFNKNSESARPFQCSLCPRTFASKQNVFNHLHHFHKLSPVKRDKKRYLEDDSACVPASTQYCWKKIRENQGPHQTVGHSSSSTGPCVEVEIDNADFSDNQEDETINSSSSDASFDSEDSDDADIYDSNSTQSGCSSSTEEDISVQDSETQPQAADSPALSLLSCFLRHNMSASASKDVIDTFKSICPDSDTIQQMNNDEMWKSVSSFSGALQEFHYCPLCSELFPEDPDIVSCTKEGCDGLRYKGTDQTKNGRQPRHKFVFGDMKSQLKLLLESPGIWQNIQETKQTIRRKKADGDPNIGDITDGAAYRKMCEEGEFLAAATNLSVVMNTDGINLYSSSKVELWPIFLAINELSPAARFARENLLLAGIWQGKGKPPFQQYLSLFAKEMNDLKQNGVDICVNNRIVRVKVSVVCATVDLPAKASMLNMTYFNGAHACITCEEPGVVMSQGKGHSRCYPYHPDPEDPGPLVRAHDDVVKCMMQGTRTKRVKGFCGQSGLISLDGLDLVQGIVPDYMHGLLLGVTKTLMCKWFSPTESSQPYFVGKDLSTIAKRLKHITPPDFIERLPRDLEKNYSHFKATEFQSWLLFYCIPCVSRILPDEYLSHFAKLSEATHILLGDSISPVAILRASTLLDEFYGDFQRLYGQGSCGLNVHNAGSHLVHYVKQWGPMWAWSCFSFEDSNAMILQSVHGTGDVVGQVIKFKVAQSVLRKSGSNHKRTQLWSNLKTVSNCDVAGRIKRLSSSDLEQKVVEIFQDAGLSKVERVVVNGRKFYSVEYTRMKKRECSVVRTSRNEFGKVQLFVLHNNSVHAVLRMFQVSTAQDLESSGKHLIPVQLSNDVKVIAVQDLVETMVLLHSVNSQIPDYIASPPNKLGRAVFK